MFLFAYFFLSPVASLSFSQYFFMVLVHVLEGLSIVCQLTDILISYAASKRISPAATVSTLATHAHATSVHSHHFFSAAAFLCFQGLSLCNEGGGSGCIVPRALGARTTGPNCVLKLLAKKAGEKKLKKVCIRSCVGAVKNLAQKHIHQKAVCRE